MIYALLGRLRAAVGRFAVWEYRDSHKGIKRRDGPANGLYGGLSFWTCSALLATGVKMPPASHRAAHKRRGDGGGCRDTGGRARKLGGQKKPAPDCSKGGRWWYSRFFRRLPDDHQGKSQNKQDNQAESPPFSRGGCYNLLQNNNRIFPE